VGEVVKIRDGAFENLEGKIESIDSDRGRLNLSVSIFGRSTQMEVEYWQVERE
jgi:transcriptional antiterminator NusG